MSEPLLGRRTYVAELDEFGDGLVLRSNVPGPAGSLIVELDGVTMALDAADPSLVNFIEVEDARASTAATLEPGLLRRLVGDATTDAVCAFVASGPTAPRRIADVDDVRDQPVPSRVARLAVALAGAATPGLLPEEAALATLEALASARSCGLFGDLPFARERLEQAAATMVAVVEPNLERLVTTRVAAADSCELAAEWVPEHLAVALRDIAAKLRVARPASRPAAAVAALGAEVVVPIWPDSLPLMAAERLPTVIRTSNDEYEVRLAGWAGRTTGWWVRAFRADGQVPLAAAPLLDDGPDALAQILIPGDDGEMFELDVVDDPSTIRPSREIAAFRAAIASGQRAARLERLDRRNASVHAWQRSGELHRQAGDEERARQADAIASNQQAMSRRAGGPRVAATIADHCLPTT